MFSVICKVETFEADKAGLHALIGLPYKEEAQVHYNSIVNLLNSTVSTEDSTKKMFQDISEDTKKILRHIYKYDFQMFDYDPLMY